jgi:hypothetical protein
MYLPIEAQPSCALAWLAAAQSVDAQLNHEAYNVVVGVENPVAESLVDGEIIERMDSFLREHEHFPVGTIANTIFPQSIYDRHGSPNFYNVYLEKVYPRIKKTRGDWGRYFERMISFPLKKNGASINPLQDIVAKMKRQIEGHAASKMSTN